MPNHSLLSENVAKLIHNRVLILWPLPRAVSSTAPFEHPAWSGTQGTCNSLKVHRCKSPSRNNLIVMPVTKVNNNGMPVVKAA
jgi:hypothetical protein